MQGSYLDGSYLGGSEVLSTLPVAPAIPQEPIQQVALADDSVALPGGIVIPKKTLMIIAVVVAAAVLYIWHKKRNG